MRGRGSWSPIGRTDAYGDVFGALLGVFDDNVEVSILIEDPRIDELIFHFFAAASPVRGQQLLVGIGCLRILVQIPHVGVGGRVVQVKVIFLYVLPMIALAVSEPVQTLIEDGIFTVPQRD